MKAFLKSLTFGIIFILAIGFGIAVYILQAPPVEQKNTAKLQIHTRTAVRGRPTVNSKPLGYTTDVYRFSLDQQYISNLNSGRLEREHLFSAALTHRAKLKGEQLDKALETEIHWQKMFANMTEDIRFGPSTPTLKVLLTGEEWLLKNAPGAGYTVVKTGPQIDVYLPDLKDAFDKNNLPLSADLEISTVQANRRWLITDRERRQTYRIENSTEKLNVYQQSKPEILTFLFQVGLASRDALAEGKFSQELRREFEALKIPLSRRAQLSAGEDGVGWEIKDGSMEYNIRNENGRLKVYLGLDSTWLRIQADENIKGWVQKNRGTIFEPLPPTLSSRQQAKERLLGLIAKVKEKIGKFDDQDQTEDTASR